VSISPHEDQRSLLQGLAYMGSFGRAEGESESDFPRTFFPVVEHARAFDPEVVLVIGPRGAGKSELFRAVIQLGLLPAISRHVSGVRLPSIDDTKARWLAAYPIQAEFPDALGLGRFLKLQTDPQAILKLWFAYLIKILREEFDELARQKLDRLLKQPGGDAFANYETFNSLGDEPLLALDRLDSMLEKSDRRIFLAYDELDTLGGTDWEVMNRAVRGLVNFWATYTRRWRRIRAKIFLRTDLYHRVSVAGGADLAKLSANRAEITWSDRNLYAVLIKRIANTNHDLLQYCQKSKIVFREDHALGFVPEIEQAQDAKAFIERMVGLYMGAGVKKGLAYRWLLEHIRDGRGHALPRPLVRLIEASAELQINLSEYPRMPRLLSPTALRRALDKVSDEHVKQSLDEWPWLENLANALRGENVPWGRREIEWKLEEVLDTSTRTEEKQRFPTDSSREFVDYLVEVGIFRARSDGRIDVADLFLAGLGLRRKGGVRIR
jgi:energy-coupling factor transporter ATP-binding protein EcfA2